MSEAERHLRIVSLVPSATELLFALGLGDDVIAVTHECDFPAAAAGAPARHAGRARARSHAGGDRRGGAASAPSAGDSIYALDTELLRELRPDLIVTQALCSVCAVSYDEVRAIAQEIEPGRR